MFLGGWMDGGKSRFKDCLETAEEEKVGSWMDGWVDGWMDGGKSRFKDC